ncbi:MAG: protein kinase [Kofleriaceae bacterium]|nr:protein kinase [Kofleriaceae bacterium]
MHPDDPTDGDAAYPRGLRVGAATVSAGGEVDAAPPPVASGPVLVAGARVAGRYRIVRLLGRGGMGEVYEAHDEALGVDVALKALTPERAARGDGDRFDREVTLARAIAHPSVCRTFDLTVDADGRRYVTMELLAGPSLADRLRDGPLPLAEVGAIVDALIAGLGAAHAAGVIHRDLKPGNVLFAGERAVITDFGLARHEGDERASASDFAGTPAYMAPEQMVGRRVSTAVDVYALGVVAFEMLTGRLPFSASSAATRPAGALVRGPLPSVGGAAAATWDRLIAACTDVDPARRPSATRLAALRRAPGRPRRRIAALVGAVGLLATAGGAALVATHRGAPAGLARADGARVPLAYTVGGLGRDNVNTLAWYGARELVLGGYSSPGATLGRVALGRDPQLERSGWVARVDDRGRPRWAWRTAASNDVRVTDVAVTPDGDVVATGWYQDELDAGGLRLPRPLTDLDGFVVRLDGATGRPRWIQALGIHHSGAPRAIEVDAAGTIFVAGEYGGASTFGGAAIVADSGGTREARAPFVLALAADGQRRWVTAGRGAAARIFGLTTDGGRVVVSGLVWGHTSLGDRDLGARDVGDGVVVALDAATGAIAWHQRIDSARAASAMACALRADRLIVAGNFQREVTLAGVRYPTTGSFGAWVAELDPATGAARWSTAVTGPGMVNPSDVALDARGHAWVIGKFTLDAGDAPHRISSGGDEDGFVLEVDPAGRTAGLERVGGRGGERLRRIAARADGRLAIGGHYAGRFDAGGFALTSRGDVDGLVIELDPRVTGAVTAATAMSPGR